MTSIPRGALLTHVVPQNAIDMRHGHVDVYASDSADAPHLGLLSVDQLWELERTGRVQVESDSGEDGDLHYRYIHYIAAYDIAACAGNGDAGTQQAIALQTSKDKVIPSMKIHHTCGVYSNGDRKVNGVHHGLLPEHIEYNLKMRPGRAFFVDGKCIHLGYLSAEECAKIEADLVGAKAERDTAPYH